MCNPVSWENNAVLTKVQSFIHLPDSSEDLYIDFYSQISFNS